MTARPSLTWFGRRTAIISFRFTVTTITTFVSFETNGRRRERSRFSGSMPSLEIVRSKNIQKIEWQPLVHPIMCDILGRFSRRCDLEEKLFLLFRSDKSTMNDHTSAIILSPNLVLCCGKDGLLRLFRNSYEVTSSHLNIQRVVFLLFPIRLRSTTVEHFILVSVRFKRSFHRRRKTPTFSR